MLVFRHSFLGVCSRSSLICPFCLAAPWLSNCGACSLPLGVCAPKGPSIWQIGNNSTEVQAFTHKHGIQLDPRQLSWGHFPSGVQLLEAKPTERRKTHG